MTIEIHQPELEALINQQMSSGQFSDVEQFLLKVLRPPQTNEDASVQRAIKESFPDFIRNSPLYGSEIDLERQHDEGPRQLEL